MRFAYHPSMCDPSFYLELGKAAESAGFDVITFPDSICYPKECDSTYPYNDDGSREFLDGVPFLEPFSIIPAIAAVTSKLEFSTSVYKLAPRQAVTTAKFVTTLGVMTNNRFHFGIGVSPWYEDFLATGERWERRGKRMDEQIDILKGLMNGEYFGYKVIKLRRIRIMNIKLNTKVGRYRDLTKKEKKVLFEMTINSKKAV